MKYLEYEMNGVLNDSITLIPVLIGPHRFLELNKYVKDANVMVH